MGELTRTGLPAPPQVTYASGQSNEISSGLEVLFVHPSGGSAAVSVTTAVYLVFNQNIQPGAAYENIELRSSSGVVDATNNIQENALILQPTSPLQYATSYSFFLPADAVSDLSGNVLDAPFSFDFTTEAGIGQNNSEETAYPIRAGNQYVSSIAAPWESDYYVFMAEASGDMTIRLKVPDNCNYDLTIRASDIDFRWTGNRGTGIEEVLTFRVIAGETYYVQVYDAFSFVYDSVTYTLDISGITPPVNDAYEFNDRLSEAYEVYEGTDYASAIGAVGDIDYYTFTAAADGAIRFDLVPASTGMYRMNLIDEQTGLFFKSATSYGQLSSLHFYAKAGQNYVIRIDGNNRYTSEYVLRVGAIDSSVVDTYEFNDETPYEVEAERSYSSYISVPGDVDKYLLIPEVSGNITIDLIVPTDKNYDLEMSSGAVSRRSTRERGMSERIELSVQAGTPYTIRVSGDTLSSGNYGEEPYILQLGEIEVVYADNYEPNNNPGQAFAIEADKEYEALIPLPLDHDYYSFIAEQDGIGRLILSVPDQVNYNVDILNSETNRIIAQGARGLGQDEELFFRITAGERYYVYIFGASGEDYSASPYRFRLELLPNYDIFENNDTMESAIPIQRGIAYASYIGIPGDQDYFMYEAEMSGVLTVSFAGPESKHYKMYIYDAAGNLQRDISGAIQTYPMRLPTEAGNVYYIKISGISLEEDYGDSPYTLHAGYTLTPPQNLRVIEHIGSSATLTWDSVDEAWGNVTYDVYRNDSYLLSTIETTVELTGLNSGTTAVFTVKARNGIDYDSPVSDGVSILENDADLTLPSKPVIHLTTTQWTNQSVEVTIYSGEDADSGVWKSQYKIGSHGEWIDYDYPLSIDNEGETVIYARTLDRAGNISEEELAVVKIDTIAPQSPAIYPSGATWLNEVATVTITPGEDSASGVLKTQYKLGGAGEWLDYTGPFAISEEGETPIRARTLDVAGNYSAESVALVRIDLTAPTSPTVALSTNDWTNNPVTVTITPGEDSGSGVLKTQYKLGGAGEWLDYTGPFAISEEGETPIYARTLDYAGHVSEEVTAIAKLDFGAPTSPTVALSTNDWTNNPVTVTITPGGDNGSGVLKTQYKLGGAGEWLDYTGPFAISEEGETAIYARTLDYAGHVSEEVTALIKIDRTPPSAPTDVTQVHISQDRLQLKWKRATDNIGLLGYKIYDGPVFLGLVEEAEVNLIGITPASSHQFSVRAVDIAGNESAPSNKIRFTTYRQPTYHYDPQGSGQLQRIEYEDGTIVRFEYDLNGNLIRTYYVD
ncbi:OmpL47-type beta-barrel domain-containing protein [Xylanibacillus composti]|nr:Ig-like domain-containing protein [Xylanibacillus composti]